MSKEKENTLKQLLTLLLKNTESPVFDLKFGKEFIGNLATLAGKGKDEIVQLICREIGVATAAVLKEPLSQILKDKKLQLTLELVPKSSQEDPPPSKKKNKTTSKQ